jgi:thiosulfate/3-mercaptopyruvate sulfurtransferase
MHDSDGSADGDAGTAALDDLPPSAKFVHYALRREGPLSQTALVETTRLSRRTVHAAVDRLAESGLVRTRADPADSRRTLYLALGGRDAPGDALVSAGWVADRLEEVRSDDPSVRLLEAGPGYEDGHIPGAVDAPVCAELGRRGVPDAETLFAFLRERGVGPDTTVVTYASEWNTCGAYLYWLLRYYGHENVRVLDGGKDAWTGDGRNLVTTPTRPPAVRYPAPDRRVEAIRARRGDIEAALETDAVLLDVRTDEEFSGRDTTPPRDEPEPLVPGHIPGTINVEWTRVLDATGRFRPADDLLELFVDEGVAPNDEVIVYCNVGERAALVWFALSEVVGYDAVSNYDGSWIEWSSQLDSPVASDGD